MSEAVKHGSGVYFLVLRNGGALAGDAFQVFARRRLGVNLRCVRFTPIFDTGVFINASKGAINASDWRFLRKHVPGHGCPLSAITLGELLMGLHGTEPTMFSDAQKALKLAKSISRGRVLEQPASFLAERVFRATHPAPGLRASQMKMWLDLACKARAKQDLNRAGVHYKGGLAGLDLSILARDIDESLALHIRATEKMLDGLQPDWLKMRNTEGASLPEADRNRIRDQVDDELWKKDVRARVVGSPRYST